MSATSKRAPMKPTKLSPQEYERTVGSHFKRREGAVPRIYTDGNGIPTMGAGIALAARGKDGTFALRDVTQIGAEISGDAARPYRFTPQEEKLLNDTVGKLNDPKLGDEARKAEARKLIPPYKYGNETAADNKFGFTLSDERIAKQAKSAWDDHRKRAMETVRDQAKARGWSEQETDAYIDSLKGSKQEIALTSLAYNAVRAPKATGAMLDGDPATLRKEILYDSNPPSNGVNRAGIAARRKDEADFATGSLDEWTPEQREQWRQIASDSKAKRYMDTFPDTFPQYGPPLPPENTPISKPQPQLPQGPSPAPAQAPESAPAPEQTGAAPPEPPQAPEPPKPEPEPAPPSDPRIDEMAKMAAEPIANKGRSALLKPVEKLTEAEMKDMIHSAQGDYRGWKSGDPLKYHTFERVQDWHASVYGDGPQQLDWTGKPIEPKPVRPIPQEPSPHATPQGEDLWQATGRLGGKVAEAARTDGYADAVKGLQRGLNLLGEANPLPQRSPSLGPYTDPGRLAEDGQYGPRTDFALKSAAARLGPHKVEDSFALGRFNAFARNARGKADPQGLEERTHAIFGPLLRAPGDDKSPKVEAGVLQHTLNDFGKGRDGFEPLKVDDWIGPKTTAAFGKILEHEDPDDFTRSFGRGLGLI